MLKPGRELAGRYVVGTRIGAGGMGVVYRAEDEKLGRPVALKVLPASDVGDSAARERLIREARAAAKLAHPGIVQVFDVGETDDGGAFLVMELVHGKTVRALLRDEAVDRELALRTVSDVAATLASAHAEGLVHRDVKPDNIMVRDDGRIVVLDFGLVKSIANPLTDTKTPDTPTLKQLTLSGAIVGTPAYIAPEQARGQSCPATDQWALAIVAYELLTGSIPWEGEDSTFMLAQILMDPPRAASDLGDVPPDVDSILARALSKNPADRFDDIVSFADALVTAYGETATATQPGAARSSGVRRSTRPAPSKSRCRSKTQPAPVPAVKPRIRRWAVATAVGLACLGALLWVAQNWESPDDDVPEIVASPLTDPTSIFACPIFEAEGVDEPSGWLGAAASLAVCRRIGILTGGDEDRMLTAAHLLDLPRLPTDDFPDDPYGEDDARSRTLSVATERAVAWIDGRVRRTSEGTWELEVQLLTERGVIGQTSTTGEALHLAADAAVRELIASGAVPAAERLVEDVRDWTLLEDPEHLLTITDMDDVLFTRVGGVEFCERAFRELPATHVALIDGDCARFVERPEITVELDHSTPFALGITGLAYSDRVPGGDADSIADELAAAREEEPSARGRAWLAYYEGFIRLFGSDTARAAPILRIAAEGVPLIWNVRALSMRGESDVDALQTLHRVNRAWRPDLSMSHWTRVGSLASRLDGAGRAHALAPHHERYGISYGSLLIEAERFEDARSLVARLRARRNTELAGVLVEALLEMRLGRFQSAEEKLGAALSASTREFGVLNGGIDVFDAHLRVAVHLGHGRQLADELLGEYVLVDPPRLYRSELMHEPSLAIACAYASPEIADRSLDAIVHFRETQSSGRFAVAGVDRLMAGARLHAHGDAIGAAATWRPLVRRALGRRLPAGAFDAAGETALARHLDQPFLDDESYGGAHPAQWREALRCEAERDHACARRYATRIVDAWSTADAEVPAVARMQELLARLP